MSERETTDTDTTDDDGAQGAAIDVDPDQPYVLTLRHPLVFKNQRVDALTIRPGKAKDLRGLRTQEMSAFDTLLALLQRLAALPAAIIDELEGEDLADALEVTSLFFQAIQPTGKMRLRSSR